MQQVIILRGVPGAGKSTYAKTLGNPSIVSADYFLTANGVYKFDPKLLPKAHRECWAWFYAYLKLGVLTVVVDNTNTTAAEIAPYVLPAETLGYAVTIVTLRVDPLVAAARNIHGVPTPKVLQMHQRLLDAEAYFPPYWKHVVKEVS